MTPRPFSVLMTAATITLSIAPLSPLVTNAQAAERAADVAEANALFAEGRGLMEKGALAEACPKLERSFMLAPRLGTMLNVGSCFERSGRLARALAIYERAAAMAREAGRPDREQAARDLATAIEPRLGRLLLVIADPATGIGVDLDGEPVSTRAGVVLSDPGTRVLSVHAPGRTTWSATVAVQIGTTTRVDVPKLEKEASRSPVVLADEPPVRGTDAGSPLRTIGIVSGVGVAVVGLTVGTIFGLNAKAKYADSSTHCDSRTCDAAGLALIDDAKHAGNVSTAAFIGAGVGLATSLGFYVLLAPNRAAVAVAPNAGGGVLRLHTVF